MPLSDAEFLAALIRAGMMPSVAQQVVDASRDTDQLPTPEEIDRHAAEDSNPAAAAQETAHWWWYTPDVPQEFKRLLGAGNAET